jgi:hypothetical protein
MWRQILRWLSPLLLAGACFLPTASAAPPTRTSQKEAIEHTPGGQYVTAFASLLVVLVILCKPSRKTYLED